MCDRTAADDNIPNSYLMKKVCGRGNRKNEKDIDKFEGYKRSHG
jgi:hypothetical protein